MTGQPELKRQKLQGAYDLVGRILALEPNDLKQRKDFDTQLAAYLEDWTSWAIANGVELPKFPIIRIRQSEYSLPEVMAQIDIAEIEVRVYLERA